MYLPGKFPCTVSSSASAQRCPWSEGDTHQLDEAFNLHLNHSNWSLFSPGATTDLTPISQQQKHRVLQGHSHERRSPLVNRKHFLKATTRVPNTETAGKRVPESSQGSGSTDTPGRDLMEGFFSSDNGHICTNLPGKVSLTDETAVHTEGLVHCLAHGIYAKRLRHMIL